MMSHIPLARLASLSKVLSCVLASFLVPTGGMAEGFVGLLTTKENGKKREALERESSEACRDSDWG